MIWVKSDENKDGIPQWDLYENDYMAQLRDFVVERIERKGCHLLKSLIE
jgi:hypothetical protein